MNQNKRQRFKAVIQKRLKRLIRSHQGIDTRQLVKYNMLPYYHRYQALKVNQQRLWGNLGGLDKMKQVTIIPNPPHSTVY